MNKGVFTWQADTLTRPEAGVVIWRTESPSRIHEVVDLSTPYAGTGVWDAVREVIREGEAGVTVIDRIDQKPAPFETTVETRAKVEKRGGDARSHVFCLCFRDGRTVRLGISSESFENVPIECAIETHDRGVTRIVTRFTADVSFASITARYGEGVKR